MNYQLEFILGATSGTAKSQVAESFSGFTTDNRDAKIKGSLFIPLVGENHDAHRFVEAAVEAGAAGVLYHRWDESWERLKERATFIAVEDTLKALQSMAKAWRKTLKGKVLGLTGSNGKTTTKDFLSQIIAHYASVNASYGSFNNHWGVPFTLLNTDPDMDYCVVEIGMNHGGEISHLMTLADPDVVAVTNVGRAHMGNFSDGIEGVARAKEEIYESAKPQAQLVFNIDNSWTQKMYQKYMDRPSYTFSLKNFSADVYFKVKEKTSTGLKVEGQIGGVLGSAELSFWGEHNLENLAAAVALAYIGGLRPEKIWPVLKDCHTGWGRNQWVDTQSGMRILFDGYNANPDSFMALLGNVAGLVQQQACTALFGEMLELGEQAGPQHYEMGQKVGSMGWRHVTFVGPSGNHFKKGFLEKGDPQRLSVFENFEQMQDSDWQTLQTDGSLVIKGSRGGRLERAIPHFQPTQWQEK